MYGDEKTCLVWQKIKNAAPVVWHWFSWTITVAYVVFLGLGVYLSITTAKRVKIVEAEEQVCTLKFHAIEEGRSVWVLQSPSQGCGPDNEVRFWNRNDSEIPKIAGSFGCDVVKIPKSARLVK